MLQVRVKILYNKKIKGNYFHLLLRAPKIAKESVPGQFLMVQESIKHFPIPLRKSSKVIARGNFLDIKVNDAYEPLLRRPLSIHMAKGANIGFLYEVVGQATEILSRRKPGEYLDVIGPLGNGFNYPLSAIRPLSPRLRRAVPRSFSEGGRYPLSVLVAGGMGVAPLVFLAEKLAYSVERIAYRKEKGLKLSAKRYPLNAIVLIGARTKDEILCEKEFKELGCEVKIATDDGSIGFEGYVSELLKEVLSTIDYRVSTIYACGPKPMLKEISKISKKYTIPEQLSLEEHMACGIGACLGCIVNTKEGFKRVCKEGPVFNGDEIIW